MELEERRIQLINDIRTHYDEINTIKRNKLAKKEIET